jgi:hypothetical protein
MDRIKQFILVFIILALSGCEDEVFNTSHPDEGGIILTTEWSQDENAVPPAYLARTVSREGTVRDFDNLSGTTNSLVVDPGEVTLYVYNDAEQIRIDGEQAIVTGDGNGIAATPGTFFSYCGQVRTEQDKDTKHTALMKRRNGELKLSLAIKPSDMISRIAAVNAVLDGVASEMNLQTNALSRPSSIAFPLPVSAFYATATVRLLGFDSSAKQNLRLNVEFEDGRTASVTNDISSLVAADFNALRNGIFLLNATMTVSDGGVTVNRWECNTELRYLSVSASEIELANDAATATVQVATDQSSWGYSAAQADWLTIEKAGDRLNLTAAANRGSEVRRAVINISAGGLSENITVTQSGYVNQDYSDGEIVMLQTATVGNGINIVMMGDGYTDEHMARGAGKYEQDMRAAVDHFFSVYPYTEYRDHFNVYMVVAVSREEGISNKSTNTRVDTKFEALWNGITTHIECNDEVVFDYLSKIPGSENANYHDVTVILLINADIDAGTCSMYFPISDGSDFGNGFSISMCPTGDGFKEVVVHEAGGHGFAKAMDEYYKYYHPKETIPSEEKDKYKYYKERFGWCENIDFYDDILLTSWRGFAGMPKYSMVGTFEGACTYGKGIWRPEYNSCMNDNVLYFNAPTRWAQVRRIKRLAGFDYSFEQFLQDDVVPAYPSMVRSGRRDNQEFVPFAPPVMKIMNDRPRKK